MSDYGLFESDEVAQNEPERQARTAARHLDAAINTVRSKFGSFLLGATGIDEFEDRWHLSKNDIRATVEPHVFPNTGTMRRIQNAMKSDWKLAHPYKLGMDHEDAGFGSMPEGDGPPTNLHLDETYHPSSGNLVPKGDFEGWKNSVDQGGPQKVQRDFTPGGDSGSDRQARRRQAGEHEIDNGGPDMVNPYTGLSGGPHNVNPGQHDGDPTTRSWEPLQPLGSRKIDVEAAKLVADIYTDFAESNGLRVASVDSLNVYASTGIAESDYRILANLIRIAEEEEAEKAAESDDEDDSDDDGDDYDFGGEGGSEGHDEPDEDNEGGESDGDEDNEDEDDDSDSDDDYDFGGDDDGGEGGGQQYTVPDQAPDLDPQMLDEIPHDDPQGAAPVPPNVIDSLLGLPEGTIEQLLLEEVEQGQGGGDGYGGPPQGGGDQYGGQPDFGGGDQGAPQGGGDDFLGEGGDEAEQEPQRMAARRRFARLHQAKDCNCWDGYCRVPGTKPCAEGSCEKCDTGRKESSRRQAGFQICRNCSGLVRNDGKCERCGRTGTGHQDKKAYRQFWAAPDESESDMMGRQNQQQRDSFDTKFGPAPQSKPNIQELYARAQNGDREAYATLKGLYQERGWTAARRFWAADGDQEPQEDPAGGEDPSGGGAPPQGDPAQAGGDPAAMGGQPMMPPPGSASVAPPAPAQPLENQPAEDALLDTANQAIMQMIDRETAEYQQIIGPLSQALQAVQFAQQVEQTEHPLDVTPPQGTVDSTPAAAPGGAENPQQQLARLLRQAGGQGPEVSEPWADSWDHMESSGKVPPGTSPEEALAMAREYRRMREQTPRLEHRPRDGMDDRALSFEGKKVRTLKNAARLIARTYGVSESMLREAMGRRNYEHVAEAFHILPPQALESPEVRAAARHIAKMFAAENPMFNEEVFMASVVGQPPMARAAATGKDRYENKSYTGPRDKRRDEHGEQDRADAQAEDEQNHWEDDPDYRKLYRGSRSRLPFDRPRTAGETLKNTPTMDAFEFPRAGEKPEITDNIAINELPKMVGAGRQRRADLATKVQKWLQRQTDLGLNLGGDQMAEKYLTEHKHPSSEQGIEEVHTAVGAPQHQTVTEPPKPVTRVPKATNPTTKKATLGSRIAKFIDSPHGGYHTRDDDDPEHVFTNPRNGEKYMVQHEDGTVFKPGDIIGDEDQQDEFRGIAKYPEGPSGGKLTVNDDYGPAYYPSNYNAEIVPYTRDWDPDDNPGPSDPRIKGASWGEWEPPKTASFFTRKVPGWRWDDHLNGYLSKEARTFTCSCGDKVASPSYKTCKCGKIWNVYAIGDTHHLASDTADMYIAREIPVRDNVIMANKKMAGTEPPQIHDHMHEIDDTGLPYWLKDEYERKHAGALRDLGLHERLADFLVNHAYNKLTDANLSGNEEEADKWYPRSCGAEDYLKAVQQHADTQPKEASRHAQATFRQYLAEINRLADWTKYDDEDPAKALGKSKPPSTTVRQPPKDWAKRLPKGDVSRKGGTWTPPPIVPKSK